MCLSETPDSPILVDYWNDVRGALIFLLGPAGPSDSLNSCSRRWCAPILGGISNIGFGCASWGLLPSYLAI